MLIRFRLPKTLVWVVHLFLIFIVMFTMYRFVTYLAFGGEEKSLGDHWGAFVLGLRFDLRWISIILLPIVLASLFPGLSPYHSKRTKVFWTWYLAIATFFITFFFAADFGCFSYNKTRLNASALNFAEDPLISALMLWESYPILWMLAGLLLAVILLRETFRMLHRQVHHRTDGKGIPYQRKWFVVSALVLGWFVYGSLLPTPLQWKSAFRYNDSFKSYLALNPLQNFFTTLKFRKPQMDGEKAREHYGTIAELIDLPSPHFEFERVVRPSPAAMSGKPNVVLVICESFSMYKSSMSGNALNTTPYFRNLCDSGLFYQNCFTPHFSTARGLFATITGIPDVQLSKFSTRNPEALNQRTIINDFEGYNKFYFLGGSASFNNFEGLVKNINGVQMITEGQFRTRPVNVWGISDKELFREANDVFSKQRDPFFAIIQTADNHRPFTIPASDSDFVKKVVSKEVLLQHGFESLEEYNAFRYFDYCVEQFMEGAKKQSWFNNTVFVFVGDHGVSGNARSVYPEVWTKERLTEEHVPLLFYAPGKLAPALRTEVVSQVDVLPSIASLTGQTYTNATLGRDVVLSRHRYPMAFTIAHDEGRIGVVTNDFYFTRNLNFQREELHPLRPHQFTLQQQDSIRNWLSEATIAYYETSKFLLVNNKREATKARRK